MDDRVDRLKILKTTLVELEEKLPTAKGAGASSIATAIMKLTSEIAELEGPAKKVGGVDELDGRRQARKSQSRRKGAQNG